MEKYHYLNTINRPSDLRQLPVEVLPEVCEEVRRYIIECCAHNPGHLASSLGAVELTVALHYALSTPDDRIVWDVGHQAYAHKILTGRRDAFVTNRQFHGIAPFPTPYESEYDTNICGHASNSISVALGMAVAEMEKEKWNASNHTERHVVAVIGDGAMSGGLAFEGLNNASSIPNNLLVVLNDNHMAIDPIRGGFSEYLVDITTSAAYNKWRWRMYQLGRRLHLISEDRARKIKRFNTNIKTILSHQSNNIFQGMNLRYFGPVDGHDVVSMVRILNEIKTHKGPKVLHLITTKGKGYGPAENDQTVWHAPGEFDVETGVRAADLNSEGSAQAPALWQEVFGETLTELAREDKRVVGVTPAMPSGCSMTIMQREFPDRVHDVGIAEGHAVTFSAGLAKEGIIPYCNIYSSFLQRAYDNIIHDVAIARLHVVLCIDRAGIVGNDGATHHGLFDLAYLRPIPNLTIGAPMTGDDLVAMLRIAKDCDGPIAIRYPRGKVPTCTSPTQEVAIGRGACLREGTKMAVLTIGAIGCSVAEVLPEGVAHYDMRWLKPIDTDLLDYVGTHFDRVVTVEDGVISGGLGSAVLEHFADKGYAARVTRLGIHDQFVEHGSTAELNEMLHLDKKGLCESLLQALEK